MMNWNGWPLERGLILFVSLAYLLIGIQVTAFHYRQNFHHKSMYVPVILTPIVFVAGLILTVSNSDIMHDIFVVLLWIGIFAGIIGFILHVRGVGVRVGGYKMLRNFLVGPPMILPLLLTAMGVLGLMALYWRD